MPMSRLVRRLRFLRDHRWVPRYASDYLDGELRAGERLRVERHTEDCRSCRELLRGLQTLIDALGAIRHDGPPPVATAVLAAIHGRLSGLPQDRP
jgi:anti-sigma factor RsiW